MFLPKVTVAFGPGDHEFEIMCPKPRKSKTPQVPNVTIKADIIESKVRSMGAYIGGILKSCDIKQRKGCIIRCVEPGEFSCFPPERVICEECSGPSTSNSSGIGAWSLKHIQARASLPLRDYFKEHCNNLGVVPFQLNPISYKILTSLKEQNLKNVGLLALDEYTCNYKIPKYTSWQKVPAPDEEESEDFVAHAKYLERVSPQVDGASRDMDVDLENMFKSPPLADKKFKKSVAQAGEASSSTKKPKRTKTTTNKKKSLSQLTIEAAKSSETRNEVSATGIEVSVVGIEVSVAGIEVFDVGNVEGQPTRSVHQVKFFGSRSEMVLLEPSCPLPLKVGTEGSQLSSQHATNIWRNLLTLGSRD
uniref:Uncharacterized protein n=1 Tax=Cannabis sativa TaxID=3483 RepID=A0A803PTN5_CANSA